MADERPPLAAEATAYFVVSEALANAARYSHATAVEVAVLRSDDMLIVAVTDDGEGGANPGAGLRALRAHRPGGGAGGLAHRAQPTRRGNADRGGDPLRIVIGEDSVLLREGVARLLESGGMEVVGQAGDEDELLRKVRAHKPDVAVVDIRMPPDHSDEGLRCAAIIRDELPGTGVLVLSQYLDETYAMELLEGGAEGVGYLLKDRVTDVDAFLDAVRRVAAGQSVLDPKVVRELLGRQRKDDPLDQLTPREREVLELMADGPDELGHRAGGSS